MLVLTRKLGEQVVISGGVTVTLVEIRGDKVRLGIDAPDDVGIWRKEILTNGEPPKRRPKRGGDDSG